MSTTVSNDTADENSMRWTARILSILWANWALFITLFAMLYFCPINPSMWAILIPVMAVALLMYAGAAIIASVWGKEKFGGRLLLADGVLIFAQCIMFKIVVAGFYIHPVDIIAFLTLVLPPLVAGILFLKCHNKSNQGAPLL